MSGRLVVLDRAGRAGKSFPLATGLATLGRDAACDIRVLLPAVSPHHATITVHANQTVIRNVGSGTTLVNGVPVSVHALRHDDELALGGRRLRWEYDRAPAAPRRSAVEPALALPTAGGARAARRGTLAAAPRAPDRDLQLALELRHRSSMPASSAGGKQVAIVQPQRRDTNDQNESKSPRLVVAPHRPYAGGDKRARARPSDPAPSAPPAPGPSDPAPPAPPAPGPPAPAAPPAPRHSAGLHTPTKATLWIESRRGRARSASWRRAPPPRPAVLRRALTPAARPRETPAPQTDPTKQAAILLMARHTLRAPAAANRRKTTQKGNHSVSVLEITDSAPPSPRKSALKNPGSRSRKSESIKFDFSNLENNDSMVTADDSAESVLLVSDASRRTEATSEDDLTLKYSDSPPAPSPRRSIHSIHSRSGRILETLGSPLRAKTRTPTAPETPASPRSKSSRGSIIVQKALDTSTETNFTDSQYSRRATASVGSRRTLEAYSVVDLVSGESDASTLSRYGSAASTRFSSRELTLLGASTPLHGVSTRSGLKANSRVSRSRLGDTSLELSADEQSPKSARSKVSTRLSRSKADDSILASSADEESPRSAKSKASTRLSRSRADDFILASSADEESPRSAKSKASARLSRSKVGDSILTLSADEQSPKSAKSKASTRLSRSKADDSIVASSADEESPKSARSKANNTRASRSRSGETTYASLAEVSPKSDKYKASKRASRTGESSFASSADEATPNESKASTRVSRSRIGEATFASSVEESPKSARSKANGSRASRIQIEQPSCVSPAEEELSKSTKSKANSTRVSRIRIEESTSSSTEVSPKSATSKTSIRVSRSRLGDSKLASSADEESPKSASNKGGMRVSRSRLADSTLASPKESPKSAKSKASIRVSRSLGGVSSVDEASPKSVASTRATRGSSTPEQRGSPEEASTPVLIRSLLDASVIEPATRRRTANPARTHTKRSSARSKSLNFAPRGGEVTPTGTVSIVQDPVKNKHSSAKKSLSRRSIIDTLEDSNFVRELFNSPVKRKLSQSMTEHPKKARRSAANDLRDVAGVKETFAREPRNRLSDMRGVKEMFADGPRDDLTDVRGVRALFKRGSPRNDSNNLSGVKEAVQPRSPRNDLRRVTGVGALFERGSPRNDLADVSGIKDVFQPKSPRNDLRRVSGVRALFREEPRNDLTDVRGVRDLFKRKSPKNDLRNISGVKRALKVKSPKNDLRDVRGVRALYERGRSPVSPDVSGVARLLGDEPSTSDVLFDKLVGRPVIKANYSKSFTARAVPGPRKRRSASLRSGVFPENVEEWLQRELKDRTADRSVSRALRQLSTATVAGAAPVLAARGRAAAASASASASASDVYGAHTLPIKKRSLVDSSRETQRAPKPSLPIKKRALVHSTPLKGRGALDAAHDELGRVSPIAPASPKVIHISPKPRSARKTRATVEAKKESVKPSPKETRARSTQGPARRARGPPAGPAVPISPPAAEPKPPAASVVTNSPVTTTKRTAKEPTAKRTKKEKPLPSSPVAPRRTRAKREPSPKKSPKAKKSPKPKIAKVKKSPKGKVRGVSLLLPKPSPQLKPRPPAPDPSPKPKKPAKNDKPKAKSPKESPVKARKTRNAPVTPPKQSRKRKTDEPEQKVVRGRKAATTTESTPKKKASKAAEGASPAKRARRARPKPEPEPERGRKTAVKSPEKEPPKGRRSRNAPEQTEQPAKKSRAAAKKAPKTPAKPPKTSTKPRAASKKAVTFVTPKSSEKPTRKRAAPEKTEKPASRKRASPEKAEKSGGAPEKAERATGRARAAAREAEKAERPAARARSAKRDAVSPHKTGTKSAKGKKAAAPEVTVEAPRGRKRKNELTSAEKKEPSPKKPRGRAAADVAAVPGAAARARRR